MPCTIIVKMIYSHPSSSSRSCGPTTPRFGAQRLDHGQTDSSTRATSSVGSSLREDPTSPLSRGSRASRRSVASSATLQRQSAIDRFAHASEPRARALAQLAQAFMEDETRALEEAAAKANAQRLWEAGSETRSLNDHEDMTVTTSRNLEGIGPIADDGVRTASRKLEGIRPIAADGVTASPSYYQMDRDDGDEVYDLYVDSESDSHRMSPSWLLGRCLVLRFANDFSCTSVCSLESRMSSTCSATCPQGGPRTTSFNAKRRLVTLVVEVLCRGELRRVLPPSSVHTEPSRSSATIALSLLCSARWPIP